MKEYEKIKLYGKTLNTWKRMFTVVWNGEKREAECVEQYEFAYTEYNGNGEKVGTGSEDFSFERSRNLKYYRIFTWDGQKRNKGGYRWFEEQKTVLIDRRNRKQLKEIAEKWFPTAAIIDIR